MYMYRKYVNKFINKLLYAPEGEESCSNLCTLLIRVKTLGAILTNEISSISFLSLLLSILLLILRLNSVIRDPGTGVRISLVPLLLSFISAVIRILFLFFRLFFKTSFSNFGILSAYDILYAYQFKVDFHVISYIEDICLCIGVNTSIHIKIRPF